MLVANAPRKDFAKRIAERMGLPYPSLARYWQGRAVFPAGLVKSLFQATDHDIRVAEFFLLEGTGYRLERERSVDHSQDISRAVMSLNTLEGEISRLYLKATHEDSESGQQISFAEAKDLESGLRNLCRTAEDLRAVIRRQYLKR
jgi:hypothetical protein